MANIHSSGKSERTSGFGPEDKRRDPPDPPRKGIPRESKDGISNREKAGVDSAHVAHGSRYGKHLGIKRKGS